MNQGLASSLNQGLSRSKGEFIARFDADDIADKKRLAKQVDLFIRNSDIGICGSWAKAFGAINCEIRPPTKHQEIYNHMSFDCPFVHSSVIIRSSFLKEYSL